MKYIKKIFNNKYRLFSLLFFLIILVVCNITYFKTYSERIIDFASDPDYLETQVNGNVVYINDLDSDYYYYMGLNYTSNDGTIPTKENKNIYNDSNLVQVKITYQSEDDDGLKGYVSLTERQDKYIYFSFIFSIYINNINVKVFYVIAIYNCSNCRITCCYIINLTYFYCIHH